MHVCIVPLIVPFAEAIYGTVQHLLLIIITVVNDGQNAQVKSIYDRWEQSATRQEFSAKIVPCITTLFDTSARSRYDISPRVL